MKSLYSQLHSLIPPHASSSEALPEQIDEATNYIKQLQTEVENLKTKKKNLLELYTKSDFKLTSRTRSLDSPIKMDVNETKGALEVVLVTGLEYQFVFNDVIRVLHEENADVLRASYSVVEGVVSHIIHAQIAEGATSYAAERISERLKKFAL